VLNNPPGVLPNSLVIVYLAGHGVQINDTIYFGTVDASIDAPVSETFVNVNDMIKRLKRFTAAQVIIADVCRDNPFAEPIATR
jgi:uncharacterized caspase-like protein